MNSASGHLHIDSGFRWIEALTSPSTTNRISDTIQETVVLHRINAGPVTVHAMLALGGGGRISGPPDSHRAITVSPHPNPALEPREP